MKKLFLVLAALSLAVICVPDDVGKYFGPPAVTVDEDILSCGTDATIVKLLTNATAEDKRRIVGAYTGMGNVLKRDNSVESRFIDTSEQFTKLQDRTLAMAIEKPGKYEGLDVAIQQVYMGVFKTDDVIAITPDLRAELMRASYRIANSAR